jgi:hypothetical protein
MRCSYRPLILAAVAISLLPGAQAQQVHASNSQNLDATARLIEVQPDLLRLREYASGNKPGDRWQILWLHQHIYERIMAASLLVDATTAQIDNEIVSANEVRGYLSDRRDRIVNRANLLGVIIGGGLGATSSGMQFSSSLDKPGAAVGIGAGALSAGFGVAGIHAQRGTSSRFDFKSNMLAELFDRPVLPDSHFPDTIASFLNEIPQNNSSGLTRKEQLIQTWIQVKRIDSLSDTEKIDHVTSQPSELLKLSIDDFEDRAAMLADLRARISFLKRDLGALLASLPSMPDDIEGENKDLP